MKVALAAFLAGLLLSSCIYDDGDDSMNLSSTISINAAAVSGGRAVPASETGDNSFMALFWMQPEHLEQVSGTGEPWPAPYLASRAPQLVSFYEQSAFDTRYPYPYPETTVLYATGYAPGNVLQPRTDEATARPDYRTLTATVDELEKGRCDFLSCDVWREVYRGCQDDPFAQDKNKLYFRHLAAKLVFYADRDEATMENRQYVRNVQVKNLRMSTDGGTSWTPMYTPNEFEWKGLTPAIDFTSSYEKMIDAVRGISGNAGAATTVPKAGYKAVGAETFAGEGSGFVLQRSDTDRVPIDGMSIDSCYVCNPMAEDGTTLINQPIRLKMDIRAEMSFDPNFPMKDDKDTDTGDSGTSGDTDDGSGSLTDDLTFTREWKNVTVDAIAEVTIAADGTVQKTNESVREFAPGCEYRIYIHFYRTGVNLAAQEWPWNFDGIHYITIPGGNQSGTKEPGGGKQAAEPQND